MSNRATYKVFRLLLFRIFFIGLIIIIIIIIITIRRCMYFYVFSDQGEYFFFFELSYEYLWVIFFFLILQTKSSTITTMHTQLLFSLSTFISKKCVLFLYRKNVCCFYRYSTQFLIFFFRNQFCTIDQFFCDVAHLIPNLIVFLTFSLILKRHVFGFFKTIEHKIV